MFLKKQMEIRNMKQETEARELVNPYEGDYERKADLFHLIYNTKESNRLKDSCKFIPEGNISASLS